LTEGNMHKCHLFNGERAHVHNEVWCGHPSVITKDLMTGLMLIFTKTGDSLLMSYIKFSYMLCSLSSMTAFLKQWGRGPVLGCGICWDQALIL
jgi:hypothetical protein